MSYLNDVNVPTAAQDYTHASIFRVEAGCTAPQGGDAGHGSRAVLRLSDLGGTTWSVTVDGEERGHPGSVELWFGGDAEVDNLVRALEFAALTLRQNWSR